MDRFFGGPPPIVFLRLAIISFIVGIVLAAFGLDAFDIFASLEQLAARIYELGFSAFEWGFRYFLLGAAIVFPIWGVARALKLLSGSRKS